MFLRIVIILTLVIVVSFFITQLLVPLWTDKPMLPMFRGKTRREKLDAELKKLIEFQEELQIQRKISNRFAETMIDPIRRK